MTQPTTRREFLKAVGAAAGLLTFSTWLEASGRPQAAKAHPNILWIIMDDVGAELPCYGERAIRTPNIDRLVREGTKFDRAFLTAPVCSPSRSAMITGMYQTSIGAHHHRSGRGVEKIHLPQGVEPVPALFKRAGYTTCNGACPAKNNRLGKTDYNFEWDPAIYDGADWAGRAPGQILKRLEDEGILEQTVIIFMGDNGISHARGKQFLYDEGIRMPFIMRGPGIPRGKVRGDLVEHIDMAAVSLALAGIATPGWIQGRNFLAADYKKRDAVFAARDRGQFDRIPAVLDLENQRLKVEE